MMISCGGDLMTILVIDQYHYCLSPILTLEVWKGKINILIGYKFNLDTKILKMYHVNSHDQAKESNSTSKNFHDQDFDK